LVAQSPFYRTEDRDRYAVTCLAALLCFLIFEGLWPLSPNRPCVCLMTPVPKNSNINYLGRLFLPKNYWIFGLHVKIYFLPLWMSELTLINDLISQDQVNWHPMLISSPKSGAAPRNVVGEEGEE
jgi:hypothetical protein